MIRLENAFIRGKAFIPYITAGDPAIGDSVRFIETLVKNGADAVALGIPFSDPTADCGAVARADKRALEASVSCDAIFDALKSVVFPVPLIMVTYANPAFSYGYERFFGRLRECAIAAVIFADVPYEESGELKKIAGKYKITVIDTVAVTSGDRIGTICRNPEGFACLMPFVCEDDAAAQMAETVRDINEVTKIPVCAVLNMPTLSDVKAAVSCVSGVITCGAVAEAVEMYGKDADEKIAGYARAFTAAVHG